MKILQINSTYLQGSTGKIVSDIHQLLLENGHESYVIYGRGKKREEKNIYKVSNYLEIFGDIFFTRTFNKHSESNWIATLKIIKLLKDIKPDVIHLHNIHGYYLNYGMLFKYIKKCNIPIIWLLHDQWAISGGAAHFDIDNLDWNNPRPVDLRKVNRTYPLTLNHSVKIARNNYLKKKRSFTYENLTIVTPSNWLKEIIKRSYLSNNEIQVINNGINLNIFKPSKNSRNDSKIIILGVANIWSSTKGLDVFNKLARDLNEEIYKIIVVGVNKKQIDEISKSIISYERTDSIEELVNIYSEADIFINPTLEDNFPTVNLEAQACGVPVITYNTGGSSENISTKVGKIVEKGDYNNLLLTIKEYRKKSKDTIDIATKFASKYSKENMLNQYLDLYKKVMQKNT
ncbi:glycosyltransferase [Aerococcus viridans]